MRFNANFQVGAVFKCIVKKSETDEIVRETGEFSNIVLNSGITQMLSNVWIDRCCVGSGNSTPTVTQTALDNFIASTTTTSPGTSSLGGMQVAEEPYYWYGRSTWRFAVGVATGNLSEIGLGWGNANLWNRALIKDNNGTPTTITVLSDEYLDVFCEVRVYPSTSSGSFDVIDKFNNIVSTHTYSAMPCLRVSDSNFGGAAWNASAITLGNQTSLSGFFIGSGVMPTGVTTPISSSATKQAQKTVSMHTITAKGNFSGTEANFSHRSFQAAIHGLMCLSRSSSGSNVNQTLGYKWQIDPPIVKTSDMILTYSVTLTISNYEPE